MVDLMLNKKAEGNIFNIGSSEYVPIKVLAKMIKERTHSKSKLRYISYRDVYGEDFEDAKCRMGDIQKIRKMIKYRPRYRIAQIIDNTVEYFEKHGHGDA
jgi:UDP-glucose 4-epimerase